MTTTTNEHAKPTATAGESTGTQGTVPTAWREQPRETVIRRRFSLFDLDRMYQEVIDRIDDYAEEHDGEVPDDLAAALGELEMERSAKIANTCRYIKSLAAEGDALEAESKRLKERAASAYHKADCVMSYLASVVPPGEKHKDETFTLGWRKSEAVEVRCEPEALPPEFQRVKVTVDPDKAALKDAVKQGKVINGVEIVTRQNIQIK